MDLAKQPGYQWFNPSRLFLYFNTRDAEHKRGGKDDGASIRDAIKAFKDKGVCSEHFWPYSPRNLNDRPPERCYKAAEGNICVYERLLDHHTKRRADEDDIYQLKACLNEQCPFVFAFDVHENFETYYGNNREAAHSGFIMPNPKGRKVGSHAVVAVGYNDFTKCIKVLNSWGKDWGDKGYFYMPYDIITNKHVCYDFWKISFAVERRRWIGFY